jgi:hypothetical protein
MKEVIRMTLVFNVGPDISVCASLGQRDAGGNLYGAGNAVFRVSPDTLIELLGGTTITGAQFRQALEQLAGAPA